MSMQPHGPDSVESLKARTRANARNSALCVAGGAGVGAVLGLLAGSVTVFVLFLVIGLAGGVFFGSRVRSAIAKDPNSPY